MGNEQIISKGFYQFSQINNFISVKNYILMRKDNNICLALRFSNDTEYTFDHVSFCVIQLNAEGKAIGKTQVKYDNMNFEAGSIYTPQNAVIVDPMCVDFRIQFYEATSDYYRYVVRRKKVLVYYDRKIAYEKKDERPFVKRAVTVTEEKKHVKTMLTAFIAVLAIIIILAANVYYMLGMYIEKEPDKSDDSSYKYIMQMQDQKESFYFGVEYAEI